MTSSVRRVVSAVTSTAVVGITYAAPAIAGSKDHDGQDRGIPMPLWQAIILFVLTPLGISAAIAFLTLLPGWMRSAKAATRGGFMDDPTSGDRDVASADRAAIGR